MREHGFYKSDDKQPPAGRKSALKTGQSKPGVKLSKVNRVQSEDGGEDDDDSCIDSEVSSDSSMSVDRPPKSLVWKNRPKSRKVSKIRTVSTIHRTTRLEPLTEDTTSDNAPQPNVGDAAGAVSEEPAPSEPTSEPTIPVETVQPPAPARKKARMVWPRGSGLSGFGSYRGTKWYDFETEEQDEHDDPPLPATTSNTRRSFLVPKYEDRHLEPEPTSDSKLPGHVKDDKPPGGDREYHGVGKTESERRKRHSDIKTFLSELPDSSIHYSGRFGSRPDTSSSGHNPEQPGTGKMNLPLSLSLRHEE